MLRTVAWTLVLYLAIKVCHILFRPAAGYGRTDVPLWTKLRAGEPMLLIGIFGLAALFTLYTTWFSRRFAEHWYAYSSGCYAKVAAAHALPNAGRFRTYDAAEQTRGDFNFAEIHGAKLGIPVAAIDRKLERDRLGYAAYYASIAARNDRRAIAASFADLDRCMKRIGAPRGDFIHP